MKETFRTLLNDLIGGYKPPADIPKPWTYPTCAKCGNAEIYTCYHEKNWGDHSCSYASHNKFKSEHLHYSCRRCHWDWCGDVQALDEVDEALDDDLGPKRPSPYTRDLEAKAQAVCDAHARLLPRNELWNAVEALRVALS